MFPHLGLFLFAFRATNEILHGDSDCFIIVSPALQFLVHVDAQISADYEAFGRGEMRASGRATKISKPTAHRSK